MKKIRLITLFIFTITVCLANDYLTSMKKGIEAIYHAADIAALQEAVNMIDRIAAVEKLRWEPHYYVAFGYIMMANKENETKKKDAFLDQALAAVERAKQLAPQESEIIALEGFVHMVRASADPESRGPELVPRALEAFGKAHALNPDNPRALILMARIQYGNAKFHGESTAEACALVQRSQEKFDNYHPSNPLAPQWGKGMIEGLREQCR